MDTFLMVSEGSATAKVLRDLVLPPGDHESDLSSSFALAFGPGPSGGVVIKRTKKPRYELGIFYIYISIPLLYL
jgi:hypothetical protein